MTTRKVKIGVMDNRAAANEFIDVWDRAERGEPPEEPIERRYFQDIDIADLEGILHKPGQPPVSIEDMDRGIAAYLAEKHNSLLTPRT